MKRRDFLKFASSMAATRVVPVGLSMGMLAERAHAFSPNYSSVTVSAPQVLPQVINIFMYGGASELAGNLTNIEDINRHSVNDYTANNAFTANMLRAATDNDPAQRSRFNDGQITANGFWKEAGGTHMEDMLASGDMAIYRTIMKKKSPTRSHRESIFMSHKGTLDIENSPGIGSRLALMIKQHESTFQNVVTADGTTLGSLDEVVLPFVSFEGDTQTFALDPENSLPLSLQGLTMDQNFNNPYTRGNGRDSNHHGASQDAILALLQSRQAAIDASATKYQKAVDGFTKREELEQNMNNLSALLAADLPDGVTYPNTNFATQLRSAVTLAIHNPQTMYIAVGTPGLGGWDDHNNGIDRYANRMNDVMEAIKSAMAHINASNGASTLKDGQSRNRTDNIIINVMGDFGRLVNLNNSGGWDHANNQNLYTFGGEGVRPAKEAAAMGADPDLIGRTIREGTSKTNNQYTVPTSDSATFEPMSVASSIYGYFGATNSHILTADPTFNPDGDLRLEDILPDLTV